MTVGKDVLGSGRVGKVLRYKAIFDETPAAMWVEDTALFRAYVNSLRDCGVTDVEHYFSDHPEAVSHCQSMLQVQEVNKAAMALIGVANSRDFRRALPQALASGGQDALRQRLVALASGRLPHRMGLRLRTIGGEERYLALETTLTQEFPDSGKLGQQPLRVLVTCRDATAELGRRKTLTNKGLAARLGFDGVPGQVYVFRRGEAGDFRVADANRAARAAQREEPLGKTPDELFAGLPHVAERMESALRQGLETATSDFLRLAGDQGVELRFSPADSGSVVVMAQNRKDELLAQRKLARERGRYRALWERLPVAVYWKGPDLLYRGVNQAFCALTGLTAPSEAVGRTDADFFPQPEAQASRDADQHILESRQPASGTIHELPAPQGSVIKVAHTKAPLLAKDGKVLGIIGVLADVSQMQTGAGTRGEEPLLLATVSHELRTPLNAILGLTDMVMENYKGHPKRQKFLKMLKSSADSALGLVENLLDYSLAGHSQLKLARQPFDLHELLLEVGREQAVLARSKPGVHVKLDIDRDVPRLVVGDRLRLRQVLANLAGNAVKFTNEGEVLIQASQHARSDGEVTVLCSVWDTGRGIPQDQLDAIFEAFQQAHETTAPQQPSSQPGQPATRGAGAGLGLAISRRLVEAMGGRIWVRSRPGVGSAFSFSIPLGLATPQAQATQAAAKRHATQARQDQDAAQAAEKRLPPMRVLLVEDNPLNATVERAMLVRLGQDVTCARSGTEALQLLTAQRFDMVILDVRMADMDGLEALRRIRNAHGGTLDPDIPVVGVSAYPFQPTDASLKTASFNAYASKPVTRESLARAMRQALENRRRTVKPTLKAVPRQAAPSASAMPADEPVEEILLLPEDIVQQPAPTPAPQQRRTTLRDASARDPLVREREARTAQGREVPRLTAVIGPCVDLNFLHRNHQNDVDLMLQMLEIYGEETPAQLAELRQAMAQGDHQRAADLAHKLAGSAGAVGAARLRGLGLAVELALEKGDIASAEADTQHLAHEHRRVLTSLAAERKRLAEGKSGNQG